MIMNVDSEVKRGRDAWSIARVHEYEKADVTAVQDLQKRMEDEFATIK